MKHIAAPAFIAAAVVAGHAAFLHPSASLAQQEVRPAAGRPMPPPVPFVTMDEKVAAANHIFIGMGKRIYYISCAGNEVSSIEKACGSDPWSKDARLEIEVIRELYIDFDKPLPVALIGVNGAIEPFGSQPSGYDATVKRYMSGVAIYFGDVQTDPIRVKVPNGPSKIVGEITLHRFIKPFAVNGPIANPLPLTYLQEVVATVARRVERERAQTPGIQKPASTLSK